MAGVNVDLSKEKLKIFRLWMMGHPLEAKKRAGKTEEERLREENQRLKDELKRKEAHRQKKEKEEKEKDNRWKRIET